jgi:hypothetical protein
MDVNSPRELAVLPDADVAAGDLIVVHINPAAGYESETTSKNQFPASTTPVNYDTAWDFKGATGGANFAIVYSSRIILVRTGAGQIQDAASFRTAGAPPAAFPSNLQAIQAAGQWLPENCGGAPCTTTSTPTAGEVSADWSGIPNNASTTSNTARRVSATDTNTKDDWAVGAPSWGVANP